MSCFFNHPIHHTRINNKKKLFVSRYYENWTQMQESSRQQEPQQKVILFPKAKLNWNRNTGTLWSQECGTMNSKDEQTKHDSLPLTEKI